MECMHGDVEFREKIVDKVVNRSEGNFLWVILAVKEILQSHGVEDVEQVLREMPSGMESLYRRMEATIAPLRSHPISPLRKASCRGLPTVEGLLRSTSFCKLCSPGRKKSLIFDTPFHSAAAISWLSTATTASAWFIRLPGTTWSE
jgi:hypothetical protein